MLSTIGQKEKKFGTTVQTTQYIKQQRPEIRPEAASAWFPRTNEGYAAVLQLAAEQMQKRALACAFHALYSNEHCLSSCRDSFFSCRAPLAAG